MAEIVIAEFLDEGVVRELAQTHDVLYEPDLVDRREDLLTALSEARAIIVRNATWVNQELLDRAPQLQVVGRVGVGVERIDQAACEARGVAVCPAFGANAITVAEYTVAGLLLASRTAYRAGQRVIDGDWPRREMIGHDLAGKTLGLAGFGDIGRAVAKRARAFEMAVIAYDPYVPSGDPAWREWHVEPVAFDTILRESDAISMHLPLTEETRHLIDAAAIARMKPGALLINTARGGIIDEAAMIAALHSGQLGGAVIDVFEREPLDAEAGAVFAGVPNLILTPHIAGVTEESNHRLSVITVENVLRVLAQGENESKAGTS
jgi:(S)-sulfolactate dehydrogenase